MEGLEQDHYDLVRPDGSGTRNAFRADWEFTLHMGQAHIRWDHREIGPAARDVGKLLLTEVNSERLTETGMQFIQL